jgi:S-adenosyl methyltransferase
MEPLAPGSYLVLVHGASDIQNEVSSTTSERYNTMSPAQITLRGRDEVARFFDGLQPTGPGLVAGTEWLPDAESGHEATISFGYNGVARKPYFRS